MSDLDWNTQEERNITLYRVWSQNTLATGFSWEVIDLLAKSVTPMPQNDSLWKAFHYMGVRPSEADSRLLSYYSSVEKRALGVRTQIKPGKLLKKFCPLFTDQEVESATQAYKTAFEPRVYKVVKSKEESDFVKAYSGKITQGTNPNYYDYSGFDEIRSLSGSCMRKSFDHIHPAAAYASGDFTIYYAVEVSTGNIGARCVVGNDSAGPIYTNCDCATKTLAESLESDDISPSEKWYGLNLVKIPLGGDNYACPYVDGYSGVGDDGDYLRLGGGEYSFHTSGYVTLEEMGYCENCDESVPESDMREVLGGCVCYSCRSNDYTYSNLMCDYIRNSDCVSVDSGVATQEWIEENDYVYCEDSDEYRNLHDCIEYDYCYYAYDSSVVYLVNGTYMHEDSQEYLDAIQEQKDKEAKEKESLEVITVSQGFQWIRVSEGCGGPNIYLEYKTTTETRLRLNYELDSNGVAYRLPELPL